MSLTNINNDNIFKKGVVGNVRKAQEDSHDMKVMTPNGDIFVVCDGMGGHVGGAKASSIAVNGIIEYLNKEKYNNIPQALSDAIQFANMQIIGFASANPEFKGMGTTACILLLTEKEAYIAHVGDSRIYLYLGKEKELHRVTKDHSYVQTLVDAGQISDDEAEHHPNKNRILKALGIRPEMVPAIDVVHPKNDDVFMICTDGLNGMICDKTIEQVLRQEISIEQKGELLINLAMQGENGCPGGQDNCTVELIKIDNSPWSKSEFTSYNPKKNDKQPKPGVKQTVTPQNNPTKAPDTSKSFPLKKILLVAIPVLVVLCGILLGTNISDKNHAEEKQDLINAVGDCTDEIKESLDGIINQKFDEGVVKSRQNLVSSHAQMQNVLKVVKCLEDTCGFSKKDREQFQNLIEYNDILCDTQFLKKYRGNEDVKNLEELVSLYRKYKDTSTKSNND